ncbi:hypothetical protein [Chamaesiphon sp.]|uniref:hypothetical protein n=1 Tax=Chamaesiphon sp. TaxID=2814140 RepID=UPI003593A534
MTIAIAIWIGDRCYYQCYYPIDHKRGNSTFCSDISRGGNCYYSLPTQEIDIMIHHSPFTLYPRCLI